MLDCRGTARAGQFERLDKIADRAVVVARAGEGSGLVAAPASETADGGGKKWQSSGFGCGRNAAGGDRRVDGGGYRPIG
jgi:hypothetical protein